MIAKVNSISLFYEMVGNGPPLILLHGNGEDHHIFDVIVKKLASDFTVYAIDSRNHGQSQKTDDYDYGTMADDVYAFIKALHLEPVHIMGFSDGAIITLMIAMKHGEVLRKMVLLGVNLKPDDLSEESFQFIKNMYEETRDPLFKLMLEQPDIELDAVKAVTTPTLLIAAEHDIFKPESFDHLLAAIPDATLKIMKGHDHGSYIIDQDILYPDIVGFFV